jgi:hypothetical protein
MIDAAKLDEIERQIAKVRESPLGRRLAPEDCWVELRLVDADGLAVTAREAIALRAAAEAHNAGCLAECDMRQRDFNSRCIPFMRTSKGRCPDCPRLDMIPLPDAQEPERAAQPAPGG